jgi:uncharacterized FAD-dependent dehydrogenase
MRKVKQDKNFFLVIIIGAGPSGLCCAYELVKNKIDTILIVEKGCDIATRDHKAFLKDYTEGVGGPGLYGDAKFCIYGRAGTKLTKFFSKNFLNRLANYVDGIFKRFDKNKTKKDTPSIFKIKKLLNICKKYGFELKMAYPVRHLGFPNGKNVVENFTNFLKRNKVYIWTYTQVRKVIKIPEGYKVLLKQKGGIKTVKCKYLVNAVGRSGNRWLKQVCKSFKIPFELNTPDIGVRIECPKNVLLPVYTLVKNPRIELSIGKDYVKTHCLCIGGEIVGYKIGKIFSVDGHADHRKGENAHLNLLYHSQENKKISDLKIKGPIVQRMEDFFKNRPSGKEKIIKNKLKTASLLPFLDYKKDINKIFPKKLILAIKKFIIQFDRICSGFKDSDNLIYAPVIEWNTYQIKVNKEMETKLKNFYVVGDGSGLTQGIVAASVSGIIAARNIISKEKRAIQKDSP